MPYIEYFYSKILSEEQRDALKSEAGPQNPA